MKMRILAVIVLYRCAAGDSISFASLLDSARRVERGDLQLHVRLHDNSPGGVAPEQLPSNVEYVQESGNTGIAGACNQALASALERNCDWLLTLDQDTALPLDSLRILLDLAEGLGGRPDIAAIVPQVRAGGRIVSPNFFALGAWPRWYPAGYNGVPAQVVFAFNSGSLLRVSALRQIGGYSPFFWLDNSDSFLYRQLARFGKRVYVAGALQVDHDFSMLNLRTQVSPQRYANILMAESAFWDLEMNRLAGLERTARLAARLFRHWRRRDPLELRRLTWQALGLRLFRSRRYRIARWRRETAARLGGSLERPAAVSPPMVSVCMAAYNGERYIEAQLRSILPQLNPGDEVVIVDDASRDRTVACIERLKRLVESAPEGPRIVLVEHDRNRGVARTFEDAVRCATGDILFLSDDDDLWAPDKVRRVLQAFQANPAARVVATGLAPIDAHDRPLNDPGILARPAFTSNPAANLLRNRFQGSTMAFRSSLIPHILPFPADRLFLHDIWIGTRNTLTGGGTAYIDEPLLLYRRHGGNYSRRFGRWKQLRLRLQLVAAHLQRLFRRS